MSDKPLYGANEKKPKLGLIVGGGDLPGKIAHNAAKQGWDVVPINLTGFADVDTALSDGKWQYIGSIGGIIKDLRAAGVHQICFAGQVNRPDFSTLKLDAKGLKELPGVLLSAAKGDDSLLRAVLRIFEKEGFEVLGAEKFGTQILAPAGNLGSCEPSVQNRKDLQKARQIALATGELDIGQGAIVCNGLVLTVEAQEGTDEMLRRCAKLPQDIRGTSRSPAGVLVKMPKPNQETRVDLPTLGLETVRLAIAAGLAGIGYVEQSTFLLDREEVTSLADANCFFLFGFNAEMSEK
jgi:DUF1009 family protein